MSQKYARGRQLRMPLPVHGITVNFCRNPLCHQFGVPPAPFDGRGGTSFNPNAIFRRGTVGGSGDEKSFVCGACGVSAVIKNNRSIVEEYRRLRRLQAELPNEVSCRKDTCWTCTGFVPVTCSC